VTSRGTRTYTLTVTDQDGCSTESSIVLLSRLVRNYYAPNVLSLQSNLGNDQFKIFTNQATEIIEEVSIYDRWGNQIYQAENLLYEEDIDGWDPRIMNKPINPGVYAWVAKIRYVDGETLTFHGTITVVN
jgi:hypothetical protein